MGLINSFYSSWDSILSFLLTNSNKYSHVYWSLLSLRFIKQHLSSWPCTKRRRKKPMNRLHAVSLTAPTYLRCWSPAFDQGIYPDMLLLLAGVYLRTNSAVSTTVHIFWVPKVPRDAVHLATWKLPSSITHTMAFQHLKGAYKKDGGILFTRAWGDRAMDSNWQRADLD